MLAVGAVVLLALAGDAAATSTLRLARSQRAFGASVAPTTGTAGLYHGPALTLRPAVTELLHHSGAAVPAAPTTVNLPLNGSVWPVGGFETPIYLGTPPQIQLVQIDTGSADLLVAQKGCKACPNPKYAPRAVSRAARARQFCSCDCRRPPPLPDAGTTRRTAARPAWSCVTPRTSSARAAPAPRTTCASTTTPVRHRPSRHRVLAAALQLLSFGAHTCRWHDC